MDGELTSCPPFVTFIIYNYTKLQYASHYLIIMPRKCTHNASHNGRPKKVRPKALWLDVRNFYVFFSFFFFFVAGFKIVMLDCQRWGKGWVGPARQTSCASSTRARGQNLIWLFREARWRESAPFTRRRRRLVSLRLSRCVVARGWASDSAALVTCCPVARVKSRRPDSAQESVRGCWYASSRRGRRILSDSGVERLGLSTP